jgi:cytochrome c
MKAIAKVLALLIIIAAGAWWYFSRPPLGTILVFSKTAEYRHDSIEAGIAALTDIAGKHRIDVIATEDAAHFSEENLPGFDAVVFLNTTGMVLDTAQQQALQRYIQAGGGFVGIHAAADTHWKDNDWPWYTRLVGAAFLSHPSEPSNVQTADLSVTDATHPAAGMFDDRFTLKDEWYNFHRVSQNIQPLLLVDETSYQGGTMGETHPIAWYQHFDGGRSFYTGLGHTPEAFDNPLVRQHLWAGLEFAMGDGELDYSRAAPESWRFKRVILDAGLDEPMAMDFTPSGEIYYIQRKGELMRYHAETGHSIEVARLEVHDSGEYGLLGLAFDPDYSNNHWLYLFRNVLASHAPAENSLTDRVVNDSPVTNKGALYQLSRLKLVDGTLDEESEQIILQIPTEQGKQNHTGGSLVFGPEGNLWISTGDTTNPHDSDGFSPHDDRPGRSVYDAARSAGNTMDLRGKILRIKVETDGSYSIPGGNLFPDSDNGRPEIYVMGLRNPFRFTVDQRKGTLYWGEVGPDSREYSETRGPWGYDEFNRTTQAGNFGWPFVIGNNEPYAYFDFETGEAADFVDPSAPENRSRNNTGASMLPAATPAWMHYPYELSEQYIELREGGRSAMAGPVYYSEDYPDNPIKLPRYYDGRLFIYEWMRRWIQSVAMDQTGAIIKIEPLMQIGLFSAPIDLKFGPDGSLYVLEYGSAWFSQNDDAFLTRIEYYGGDNPPPIVVANADQRQGAAPFTTTLRGSDSHDPNGDFSTLAFSWDRVENGQVKEHIADTADAEFSAAEPGDYPLRLTVTDADGLSSESGILLEVGNEPPRINIEITAGNGSIFREGASAEYTVSVSDLEDGSTADGGIDPARVLISLEYIPEGEDLANATLGHQQQQGTDGWAEIEGSDCLSCHAKDKASVGPSFTRIKDHYADQPVDQAGVVEMLAEKILQGSSGQWGDYSMPPHPQLDEDQAIAIAGWIIDPDAQEAATPGLPLQGRVVFDQHLNDFRESELMGRQYTGRYLLMVSYTDRGASGRRPLQATTTQTWIPALVDGSIADATHNVMKMPVPVDELKGISIMIYRTAPGDPAWIRLDQIDLGDLSTVRVGVATTSMFTIGGSLGLRLDSPDGQLLGQHTIENTSLGIPDEQDYFEFDVSGIDGVHTLYFTSEHEVAEDRPRPDFIFGTVEFLP